MWTFEAPEPDFAEAFRDLEADIPTKAALLLDLVGVQVVAYLRSLTDKVQPPARGGEGLRQAHPGGWADVTGALANAYEYVVTQSDEGATLTFANTTEYAVYLEARHGYFVLSGVTDRGGPVMKELQRIISEVAPEWEIRVE